jgi:hypothetical protein
MKLPYNPAAEGDVRTVPELRRRRRLVTRAFRSRPSVRAAHSHIHATSQDPYLRNPGPTAAVRQPKRALTSGFGVCGLKLFRATPDF